MQIVTALRSYALLHQQWKHSLVTTEQCHSAID